MQSLGASVIYRSTIQAKVFRCEGSVFKNPVSNELEVVPGITWQDGKRGAWYDYGTVSDRTFSNSRWHWVKEKLRIKSEAFFKKLRGD